MSIDVVIQQANHHLDFPPLLLVRASVYCKQNINECGAAARAAAENTLGVNALNRFASLQALQPKENNWRSCALVGNAGVIAI